jgi:hypothetical protein
MPSLTKQITSLELRHTRNPGAESAIALTLRCWWAYRNADMLAETPADPRSYLHKAYHTAIAALRKNESHIQLYMLAIFVAVEAERFDNANEMLDTAMGYRSFLRSNEPFYYAALRFLYAYLEIRQKRARSARKHIRAMEEFINTTEPHPSYPVMRGMLHLAFYEFDKAYSFLTQAYESGNRSLFLYQSLYQYYRTSVNAPSGRTLLPVINWAASHRLDVADIVSVYPDELRTAILKNPDTGEAIYRNAPHPFILREICAGRMIKADFGPEAYAYYREAERRQVYVSGLYTFLINAAYMDKAERINHYAMAEFLRLAEHRTKPMKTELAVFVYHLLLTEPLLTDLVAERKNAVLQLATHCLENKLTGREINSLLLYYWEQCRLMGVGGELPEKAEAILSHDLTRFEITASPEVRFIYVSEPEIRGMATYELNELPNGQNGVIITAVGERMRFTCLNAGRKSILAEQPSVRRMVNKAGFPLYWHYIKKGFTDFYLLAYLANHYLIWLEKITEPEKSNEGFNEAIQVFEAIIDNSQCAKPYRMRILAALGRLHYAAGRFSQALAYYGAVDENELDEAYLGQLLHVFLQTHEWGRAIRLISLKGSKMERKEVFNAIIKLSGADISTHRRQLTQAAYDVLVNNFYDEGLLSLVLNHFQGSQEEWQALGKALHALSIFEPRLDEKILRNSLWMCRWDGEAQRAFVRLSGEDTPAAGLMARFTEYSAYEILVNDVKPEYDTLALLERAYFTHKDNLLAWALCHVYLRHRVTTFQSERILRESAQSQEEAGILFPIFRENRRSVSSAYIEKNQPFLYKGLPDKNVWLYYRMDDSAVFNAKRMDYLRFGLYLTVLPLFYNETLTYYYSEEMPTGSIATRESTVKNENVYLHEEASEDEFFTLNNAVIYEQMFKYEQVEKIITGLVKDVKPIRSGLL